MRSRLRLIVRGGSAVSLVLLYSTAVCLAPLRYCEYDRRFCGRRVLFRRLHERVSLKIHVLRTGDGMGCFGVYKNAFRKTFAFFGSATAPRKMAPRDRTVRVVTQATVQPEGGHTQGHAPGKDLSYLQPPAVAATPETPRKGWAVRVFFMEETRRGRRKRYPRQKSQVRRGKAH